MTTPPKQVTIAPLKVRSHCSDNENDNDHDAKRTRSIGRTAPRRIRATHSTNRMRSLGVVIVIVIVIAAVGPGLKSIFPF